MKDDWIEEDLLPESSFENYCYDILRREIEAVEQTIAASIYAISFFIYDEDDDPERPTLTLGYNTTAQVEGHTPAPGKKSAASDSNEAKWNYAFWLQNELCVIGREGTESATLRNGWIGTLSFDDPTQSFVNLSVIAARRLQKEGVIEAKFGCAIPIIIHELEYYDQIAHQTSAANPGGMADEFVDWVLFDLCQTF
jgi:hypothetical protein